MNKNKLGEIFILAFSLMNATNLKDSSENLDTHNSIEKFDTRRQKSKTSEKKNYVSYFELPATDLLRSINFYQNILGITIEKAELASLELGVFPKKSQMQTGVIVKGKGYKPSADGGVIYLDGGYNLQLILNKVDKFGGKILVPKTQQTNGAGFFAIFLDSEGNKLGLVSPN